jgi:hypothetical protein
VTEILTACHATSAMLDSSNQVVAAVIQTPFAHNADPANQANLKLVDAVPNQATWRDV